MAGPKRQTRSTNAPTPTNTPAPIACDSVRFERFESITAFADNVHTSNDAGIYGSTDCKKQSQRQAKQDWCLNTDLDQALKIGMAGGYWLEGAQDLQAISLKSGSYDDIILKPAYDLAVVGGCVDVGEFLAGNPECMLGLTDDAETLPVITIMYVAGAAHFITSEQKFNYGRAVLALVDSLESHGYSVELVAKMTYLHKGTSGRAKKLSGAEVDIVIKQAGEPWSASAVAFAMAHPAFSRRLGFRYCESTPEGAPVTHSNYGRDDVINRPDNGIFLPYLVSKDLVNSPERALEYVLALAENQKPELFA